LPVLLQHRGLIVLAKALHAAVFDGRVSDQPEPGCDLSEEDVA